LTIVLVMLSTSSITILFSSGVSASSSATVRYAK
jgi:hypothetical protein